MVQPVKDLAEIGSIHPAHAIVVEIVGVAGSGKTTLRDTLLNCSDRVIVGRFPRPRQLPSISFFLKNGAALIPALLPICLPSNRQLNGREFAWMSILRGWPALLEKELQDTHKSILLDQGPLYLLAELVETGPTYLRTSKAVDLWNEMYQRWKSTLDLIVWLDAPDDVLMDRIRTREKDHIVKGESDEEIGEFLRKFRENYRRVIARIEKTGQGPQVLRFDTSKKQSKEIAAELMKEFGLS